MKAQGICAQPFEAVRQAFEAMFDDPQERGAGLCVQVDGERVVDLWAGVADQEGGRPWTHTGRHKAGLTWRATAAFTPRSAGSRPEAGSRQERGQRSGADHSGCGTASGVSRTVVLRPSWMVSTRLSAASTLALLSSSV